MYLDTECLRNVWCQYQHWSPGDKGLKQNAHFPFRKISWKKIRTPSTADEHTGIMEAPPTNRVGATTASDCQTSQSG